MIQNYPTLKKQINTLNEIIEESAQIQKIYSTSFYLCLAMRAPGKSIHLYLGRGKGYEGIWFSHQKPESFLRKRDFFLEYIRKHLSNVKLVNIELPFNDRLLILNYFKWGKMNQFIIFYAARSFEFLHCYSKENAQYSYFSNIQLKGNRDSLFDLSELKEIWKESLKELGVKKVQTKNIKELLEEEKSIALLKSISKKQKFLEKKKGKIEKDLEKVGLWQKIKEEIDSFYTHPFDLMKGIRGVKFKLKDEMSDGKRIDIVYQKIKGFKKAEKILEERHKKTEQELCELNIKENKLKLITIKGYQQNEVRIHSQKKNYQTTEIDGLKMGWGTSASGNDELRKIWGSRDDIWFHLNNESSAHIILKGIEMSELTNEHFILVGKKINELNNTQKSEIDLVYTWVKSLKGVKGSAGAVTHKKARFIKILI